MATIKAFNLADVLLQKMDPEELLNELLRALSDDVAMEHLEYIADMHGITYGYDIEENPSRTTVSIWFDKDRFKTVTAAKKWLGKHGGRSRWRMSHYSSDGFWAFPQMARATEKKYSRRIRSKYISEGVLLRFVPARFMKGR